MVFIARQRRAEDSGLGSHRALPRSVVVVDDHRLFADLLADGLAEAPDLVCLGVAYDLDEGLALVERTGPDLVVMDYEFEGSESDGIEATRLIGARHPRCCVVLLTGHAGSDLVGRAAAAGASSLMPKDGSLTDLLVALRTAGHGVLVVHHSLLNGAVDRPATSSNGPRVELSRRERDVLALLTVGLDARAIADQLGISLNTCRGYVKTLLHKLDAHSQLEAVAVARRRGLQVGVGDDDG